MRRLHAGEVLAISQEAGVDVDLTYGTIDEFKDTMKELWAERSDFESLGDNRKQLARTLAAYLILMAVNEHDCELHYSAPEDLEQSMASKLWGGSFRVMIGSGNNKVDLLPACIDAAYWDCKEMDHGVRVDPKEIDRLYRKATGESLSAHGFSEFNI